MSTQTQQSAQTMEDGIHPDPKLTKEERDLLFICLNYCLNHAIPKQSLETRYNFIQVYRKLKKLNPSTFHTLKDLEDFLRV